MGVFCAHCLRQVKDVDVFRTGGLGLAGLVHMPRARLALCVAQNGALNALPLHDFVRGTGNLAPCLNRRRTRVSAAETMMALHMSVSFVATHSTTLLLLGTDSGLIYPFRLLLGRARLYGSEQLVRLRGHTDSVTAMSICRLGRHAISGSADQTVCVWDLRRQELQHRIRVASCVFQVSFIDDEEDALAIVGHELKIIRSRPFATCASVHAAPARDLLLAAQPRRSVSPDAADSIAAAQLEPAEPDWAVLELDATDSDDDARLAQLERSPTSIALAAQRKQAKAEHRAEIAASVREKWSRARLRLLTLVRLNSGRFLQEERALLAVRPAVRALRARLARKRRGQDEAATLGGAMDRLSVASPAWLVARERMRIRTAVQVSGASDLDAFLNGLV